MLERSQSISDFSKQLELSAKNSKFTNNTLKIIEELNNGVKQASDKIKEKVRDLQHAITPLKEFGTNYPEFALKPKEALEKLLQEKNGQVAGAAFRDDLGGIDFVWGNKDYGLAHILQKREKQYTKLGLNAEQIKERTNELLKEIPNILQKGFKEEDRPGYAVITLNNSKVILSKFKGDNELKNHYMITSFEVDDKVLRELDTIATLSNDYRDGINYSTSNLEPNPTTNALKKQAPLSALEQANAEKLAKLEHAITPLKEFGKNYPEFALKPKEALEKLLQEKNGQVAGAALKYHIKRALERSHTISDFSKQLELSAKNSKFTNNTLKIIEELNNGVKQASEEIKEKARDFSNEKLTNEQIKELLNNAEIPTSGRDAITFGTNNLNPEIVEFLHKNNKKMIIEKASNKELELLKDANFRHPENIRASLDHDAIAHILKRHGVNSVNVRNGESPITYDDIANYRYIVNNADAILRTIDKYNKEAITAFKQINGYAVVVEQAIKSIRKMN